MGSNRHCNFQTALFTLAFPASEFPLLFHVEHEVMEADSNLASVSHFNRFAFVLRSVTHLPGRPSCVTHLFSPRAFHCAARPFLCGSVVLASQSTWSLSSADEITGFLVVFEMFSYCFLASISLVNCFPAKSQVLEELD